MYAMKSLDGEPHDVLTEEATFTPINGESETATVRSLSELTRSDISSPASSSYSSDSLAAATELETCFPMDLDLVGILSRQQHGLNIETTTVTPISVGEDLSIQTLQTISRESREHLMELTVSRIGREMQRFGYADCDESSSNGERRPNCRLTTGCIPILPNGRVLLISSSKSKVVFVLPKGGWEQDESLPVAALRETLEEAGVTGILGPPLPPLTYETKKAVRRRISPASSDVTAVTATTDESSPNGNARSVAANVHTHNRLIIFPMYVQSIYDHWPEENRVRRVVTIDEAIHLLQHRPEFQCMLLALRERNLHILPLLPPDER